MENNRAWQRTGWYAAAMKGKSRKTPGFPGLRNSLSAATRNAAFPGLAFSGA
jgi:hypothetical protein